METAMTRMAAQTAQWTMAFIARGEPSECSVHNCSDGFITSDEDGSGRAS